MNYEDLVTGLNSDIIRTHAETYMAHSGAYSSVGRATDF